MSKTLLFIFLSVGWIWLKSGFGKITGGVFVDSLQATLIKFASKNPYLWYKSILENFAIPNAKTIAPFIMWGEFTTAVLIIGASIYLLSRDKRNKLAKYALVAGLCIGFILNLNFWLASGWMSSSSESLNLLMFLIELIGIIGIGYSR